jgi:hypothetical protein
MDQWQVLLKDHHVGYISWDRYAENQKIMASNRTKAHAVGCGAAREGAALLVGLLRCAHCGHKLHVHYRGRDDRSSPRYYCMAGNKEPGAPPCLAFGGVKAEQAIVDEVLAACQPMGVEASLQALNEDSTEQKRKRRALELSLERARYDANLAQRQFDAVDPANRLVASELEARWNAALGRVSEAETRLQEEPTVAATLDEAQRQRLLALGVDLNNAWSDPAAPVELKKRILRTVINEIIVAIDHVAQHLELRVHWAGGVHTTLRIPKNKTGRTHQATDREVIELVRELAKVRPDSYIATTLNRLGYLTGPGNTWTEIRLRHLRNYHQIPVFTNDSERAWISATEAAKELNVGLGVIHTMLKNRTLPARQIVKGAPWMIRADDLRTPAVQNYIKIARVGKPAPREDKAQTLILYP